MPISKTDFIRALQCRKMLWLDAHKIEERVIPPEVQQRLDEGNVFGDSVMGIFGDFTETTAYREDGRLHFAKMIENTKVLLEKQANVICEGAFSWYGNFCAADILKKDGEGYAIYEVKNSTEIKKEFLYDLGFQRLILRKNGVPLTRPHLILPYFPEIEKEDKQVRVETENKKKPKGQIRVEIIPFNGKSYKIIDVTDAVRQTEKVAEKQIFEIGKLKRKDAEMPCISTGEQCEKPYRCWYYDYCHKQD